MGQICVGKLQITQYRISGVIIGSIMKTGNFHDYDYSRFESPIRKVAHMCLKDFPLTRCELFHKHSIINQKSVSDKEMMPLNNSR